MQQPNKIRLRHWFLIIIGVGALALVISILIALKPSGLSNEEIQKLGQGYEAARSRLPAFGGESPVPIAPVPSATVAANAAMTRTAAAATAETDQARCDRLFRKLIHQDDIRMDYRELPRYIPSIDFYLDQRKELRELAGFYEKGIRVSATARREFKLPYGRMVGLMADTIVKVEVGRSYSRNELDELERGAPLIEGKVLQITPAKVDRMLEALRFLRVTGCPAWTAILEDHTKVNWLIGLMLDPGGEAWTAPPPLPGQIETLPLELLAPREGGQYERFLGLLADMEREYVAFCAEQTHPIQFFKWDRQHKWSFLAPDNPKSKSRLYQAVQFCGPALDTIMYHRQRVREAGYSVKQGQELLDYVTRASGGGPVENVGEEPFLLLREYNEQIEARALAAALELRQGKAVPAPGSVSAESYFFDPVTRQPMVMFRSPAGPGVTRLHLAWPVHHQVEMQSIVKSEMRRIVKGQSDYRVYSVSVLLAAGHPGLAAVPELEQAETRPGK